MENDREFGRFEGKVIEKLDNLEQKIDTLQSELGRFKRDAYSKIMQNSQEIARQKGWLTGLGVAGGMAGSFIKSLIFGR